MKDHVRRRARRLAFEALYEAEASDHCAAAVFERRLAEAAGEDPELRRKGGEAFGRAIVEGVAATREEADGYIAVAAPKYPVGSLPVVDRTILRLAIWELLTDTSAPVAAVVNEAVELAHRYGGERSPAFVNGVLRTVSATIVERRPAAVAASGNPDQLKQETD